MADEQMGLGIYEWTKNNTSLNMLFSDMFWARSICRMFICIFIGKQQSFNLSIWFCSRGKIFVYAVELAFYLQHFHSFTYKFLKFIENLILNCSFANKPFVVRLLWNIFGLHVFRLVSENWRLNYFYFRRAYIVRNIGSERVLYMNMNSQCK